MHLKQSKVSIVKCREYHEFKKVKEAVRQVVDLIGGMESVISPGDHILIKPNLICAADYATGATTNPNVVFAIAELCREVGAKQVTIAEGSAIGHDTEKVFDALGFRKLAQKHNCNLLNFHKDEYAYVMNPLGRQIKRIRIPRAFIESNVVINVPVMKTHDALAVTLGLKNMKGIIHPSDKKRFHKWGLSQTVVDLGHLAMPELTIVDGTVALEGMGPVVGKPVGLGMLLASTDTIAVDRVSMDIMGFGLEEVEYIQLAGEQGLGCTQMDKIKVLGEELSNIKRPFQRLSLDEKLLEEMGIKVIACDACSGCNNVVNAYIHGLHVKGKLEKLKGCTLIYGQNPHMPDEDAQRIIRLGTCTRNVPMNEGVYVPGCPPHPMHISDFIDGKGLEKE
ncbi:DUF362 domain-containing protein [Petroclostridium sp. X23]|uniref:DUF362 domain-containing protein n=1 Tax=Petroclostridium sp. X23 TaxID=3045146 RepID=UPI0024AD017F|nr:DUF362 domain-containing protein [Petroclostridium sp. X23]WHH58056.1 DUF362 domain-containing protein [Petroclostridium sp. X23]